MADAPRAVFVCCDGLGRDWVSAARTPLLDRLRQRSLWCADHAAVFPSVTRVSAASVATGTTAARHGLHGNRMALPEGDRLVVRDVGKPGFRDHMRRALGRTLAVPTLAERVAPHGGFVAYSNVSPGAAYFLDPDHFGHVHHRAGSFAPGGVPIEGAGHLDVSHDLAGDAVMTERFCAEVLEQRRPAVAVLWLANPDLTLHGVPLGSPAHFEALQATERCVGRVVETIGRQRRAGESIRLLVGSDHGQETIADGVDLEAWLAGQGLGDAVAAGQIAVAGQGTAALLYARDAARPALLQRLAALRDEPFVDAIATGDDLAALGIAPTEGVVAAVNMARHPEANPHGVPGRRWTVAEPGKPAAIGSGQHGGWGPDETRPFLLVDDGDGRAGTVAGRSSLVDIAPTLLHFLGLPSDGMDGRPLARTG